MTITERGLLWQIKLLCEGAIDAQRASLQQSPNAQPSKGMRVVHSINEAILKAEREITASGQIDWPSGMLDLRGAQEVQIGISNDRRRLWINVDNECKVRIQEAKGIYVSDDSGRLVDLAWLSEPKRKQLLSMLREKGVKDGGGRD